MGICGYNDKIGDGLRLLFEGMSDALESKSKKRSSLEVVERELIELDQIIGVLKTAPLETLPTMFAGLNFLARALFEHTHEELQKSPERSLTDICEVTCEDFVSLLAETEGENERIAPGEWSEEAIATRAKRLGEWALQRSRETKLSAVS